MAPLCCPRIWTAVPETVNTCRSSHYWCGFSRCGIFKLKGQSWQFPIRLDALNFDDWKSSKLEMGLPWWRSGWESACQCRGHGFEPWSGRIPHATEQLGPWATTTEPAHLEPVLCDRRGHDSERPVHRNEEWPPLAATRGSPRTKKNEDPTQLKIN